MTLPSRFCLIVELEKLKNARHLRLCWGWMWIFLILASWPARAQTGSAGNPAPPAAGAAPTGSIQGVVSGKDGEQYEGVRVILAPAGAQPAQTTQTDGNGAFSFANVPAGAFTLTFTTNGFEPRTISGVLEAGEAFHAETVVLLMKQATSEVRVSSETQVEIAEEQIHVEEQQRVLGVLPNYYVSYAKNPVKLNTRQKYSLAWRSSVDPFTLLMNAGFSGLEQAMNTFPGYGQGMQGYGKRFVANYADTFVSNMIGGAILPSIFKQDPRYFYKGTGTIRSRAEYAIANAVICKGDNMRWQFNYSGVLGGLAAGGISNLYYPASDRSGAELTFENLGVGLAGSAVQNLFQEFVVKKLTPGSRRASSP